MGKYCARSSLPAARGWKPRALRDAGNEIPSGLTHAWLRCSTGWGYGVSCNGAAPVGTRLPQIPLGVSPGGCLFPSRGVAAAVLLCQTPKSHFQLLSILPIATKGGEERAEPLREAAKRSPGWRRWRCQCLRASPFPGREKNKKDKGKKKKKLS